MTTVSLDNTDRKNVREEIAAGKPFLKFQDPKNLFQE